MKKLFLSISLSIFLFPLIQAQQIEHVLGEIIVQLRYDEDIHSLVKRLGTYKGERTNIRVKKELSPPLRIWLIEFDFAKIHENYFLSEIRNQREVEIAQFNHLGAYRQTVPDDPFYDQQWMWTNTGQSGGTADADIDVDLAWDLTTGGSTANGQEIVVCVIEGCNRNHPDLQGNIWFNLDEIDGNGIDDDNNGYVDDFNGWNVNTDNDNINSEGHGTTVSGMIGAKGNNGQFVSGVNWDVKIMHVDFSGVSEANSIAAYTYPLVLRRMYNQSGGTEGAFVVATNASWGIDGGNPADAPIWCAMYDTLGAAGILSCGATANNNVDIDVVLDLPTACPSEYMVAVTATNDEDDRTFSGFGEEQIDVAAPGAGVVSINLNGGPNNASGTSFASPTVAGIIGLLYSSPCSNLGSLAIGDPAAAAALVRDAIYEGVDIIPNLIGEVKYGRVNAYNSMLLILANCGPCPKPYGITVSQNNDVNATINWNSTDSTLQSNFRYRVNGDTTWIDSLDVESPFLLSGLSACTEYEFQIEDECSDTLSGYSESIIFKTDGCCEAPTNLEVFNISETTASANWDFVLAANSYNLLLSSVSGTTLISDLTDTFFSFDDLDSCTVYNLQVQTVCDTGLTSFSLPIEFKTFGCGSCTDLGYCPSSGNDATEEWIANVSIGTLDNTSDSDNGFGDYTGLSTDLMTFQAYDINLTPGFAGFSFPEWFNVYIDFNQDGDFSDNGEEVFNAGEVSNQPVDGTVIVPGDAIIGLTRMRVVMRWNGEPNGPCDEVFNFGEVEDYCVNILPGSPPNCVVPENLFADNIGLTTASFSWNAISDAIGYEVRLKPVSSSNWAVVSTSDTVFSALNLQTCIEYEAQVRAKCIGTESDWSMSVLFMTECLPPCDEIPSGLDTLNVDSTFANLIWTPTTNANSYRIQYKKVVDAVWQFAISSDEDFELINLEPCTDYEYAVQAICDGGQESLYSGAFTFNTKCINGLHDPLHQIGEWKVFPNPFENNLSVKVDLKKAIEAKFELFDTKGRVVAQKINSLNAGATSIDFSNEITGLPSGLYFIKMETELGIASKKLIKK